MTATQHVFLIPGFFGFASFGELSYFSHVEGVLEQTCADLGVRIDVHLVDPPPTGSLPSRAARLLQVAQDTATGDGPIHLIGHSTGGLDARMLIAPGVQLPGGLDPDPIADRVRSVVTVATPHHGTHIAAFFNSLMGRQLLRALSLAAVYVLTFGSLPLSALLRLGAMSARLDDVVGLRDTVVDQLFEQLLGEFSDDRQGSLREYLDLVNDDQALLSQLSPAGLDLFGALARDRDEVRHGCVVARARRQGLAAVRRVGLDPYGQATHAMFTALRRICAGVDEAQLPPPTPDQSAALRAAYGGMPGPDDSDGIVPTLSQIRGEVIHASWADHLDVVGHFRDPDHDPPHYDWLSSGSHFRRPDFEALWGAVGQFLVQGASDSRGA